MNPITDSLYETSYNDTLLADLKQRFGPFQQHHAELHVSSEGMLNMISNLRRKKSRRSEVVMVIPDTEGRIWLHRKTFYPKMTYRLMTGGINPGEAPHLALLREAEEETGFAVKINRCLAVITYHLYDDEGPLPFVSYLFLTNPQAGQPQPTDTNEAIEDFWAVSPAELAEATQRLRALQGRFRDWGLFRTVAHEVVEGYLSA